MDEAAASDEEPSVLNEVRRRIPVRPETLDLTNPLVLAEFVLQERERRRALAKRHRRLQEEFFQLRDLVLAIAQQADDHETKMDERMGALRIAVDGVKSEFPGASSRIAGLESAVNSLFELHDINQPVIDNLKSRLQQLMADDGCGDDLDEESFT